MFYTAALLEAIMKKQLRDRKNWLVYAFWSRVNALILSWRLKKIKIHGLENLPPGKQPFILVSNHISRWDGLLIYHLLGRPANFLVSPAELLGFQGTVLQSMGAFPASSRFDLKAHVQRQLSKGEPVVVFPEGDIYRDGSTHTFKSGAARLALNAVQEGIDLPVVPVAIKYSADMRSVEVMVAPAVNSAEYEDARTLTERLFREVCHLRYQMGSTADLHVLFENKPSRHWQSSISA
jgi:1-acyl-sn-glycerol-3-phosphate acyltransferase